jgi:hypothetical protein
VSLREPPSLTEPPGPTVFAVPIAAPPSTTADPMLFKPLTPLGVLHVAFGLVG